MKCKHVQRRLPEYIHSELPSEQMSRMRAHLQQCPECRRELEVYRRMIEGLRALRRPAPDWAIEEARRRYRAHPEPRFMHRGIIDRLLRR